MKRFGFVFWVCFLVFTLSNTELTWAGPPLRCPLVFKITEPLNPAKGETSYFVYGKNNTETLILIHGMGGSMISFDNLIHTLSQKYRVVVYHQRGHGQSVTRDEDYSTFTLAKDLRALMDYLGIKKASILGHSMGGRVATRFAIENPDRVESLIVEDMDIIKRANPDPEFQRRVVLKSREVSRRLAEGHFKTREELQVAIEPFFNKSDLLGMMEGAHRSHGEWTISGPFPPDIYLLYWYQANRDIDMVPRLAATHIPTLFIRADSQRFWSAMTDEGARIVQEKMPNAPIVTIRGADHSVHHTQTRTFLRTVLGFLDETAKGSESP